MSSAPEANWCLICPGILMLTPSAEFVEGWLKVGLWTTRMYEQAVLLCFLEHSHTCCIKGVQSAKT